MSSLEFTFLLELLLDILKEEKLTDTEKVSKLTKLIEKRIGG